MSDEISNIKKIQLSVGENPKTTRGEIAVPIYQSQYYVFKNSDHASNLREYLFKYK